MPDYVLLVRHASRHINWRDSEAEQSMKDWDERWDTVDSDFAKAGLPRTLALMSIARDELKNRNISVVEIHHSIHKVAQQTALVFSDLLEGKNRPEGQKPCHFLTPGTESDSEVISILEGTRANGAGEQIRTARNDGESAPRSAWVVIGHQPQLTRLARHLLDKSRRRKRSRAPWAKLYEWFSNGSLPANTLPLGNSEIACLELGSHPRLLWMLTEKSDALLEELKRKIGSKYDVAKFFLGALVVGTGITLNEKFWALPHATDRILAGLGAFSALLSLGLTAATLFSYDRLLMPKEFWGEGGSDDETLLSAQPSPPTPKPWSVTRPPSQIHVILFYEMVHIWTHLFVPAVCCAFAALAFLMIALAHNSLSELSLGASPGVLRRLLILVLVFALAALAFNLGRSAFERWKPRLGFDD